jgi:N-acetyl-anhydromuramoyl-L-alanine amidase
VAVELVVLHSISLPPGVFGGSQVQALFTNTLRGEEHPCFAALEGLRVSAHFFVRRDGSLMQFVACDRRAWHAGVSAWEGRANCNDYSIGIELEGLEGGSFTPAQYRRTGALLRALRRRYPLRAVCGHEHVAPGRKQDPGPGFDWSRLASDKGLLGLAWPQ